jgi:hypothetical protein
MRLPPRLAHEIIILAALALGSCMQDPPGRTTEQSYDLADSANANARTALAKCDNLEKRVTAVERRLNM